MSVLLARNLRTLRSLRTSRPDGTRGDVSGAASTCEHASDLRVDQEIGIRATQCRVTSLADETRWMDAVDQAALIAKGEVTPLELLEAAIERIERFDPALNAVTMRWFDHARDVASSPLPEGPFRGVPFLLKDLYA